MKIRIKTHNGELPSYLTVGKVYRVSGRNREELILYADNNLRITINLNKCVHLNGGSWEVVDE